MFGQAQQQRNPNQKDILIQSSPTDSISQIQFNKFTHPQAPSSLLAATSWDGKGYVWDVSNQGQSQAKLSATFGGPLLCVDWKSQNEVLVGGGDCKAMLWDINTNQPRQIGAHQQPVKSIKWIPEANLCVTGSWDRTLHYWDTRQPNPALQVQLQERVYGLDVQHPVLVVAMAGRGVSVFNLQNPQQPVKTSLSSLSYQTRCVAVFTDKKGYALGSIEGRCAIQYIDPALDNKQNNFMFKCHREEQKYKSRTQLDEVYAVNDITMTSHNTLATCGSDGAYHFWDKDSRNRLGEFKSIGMPIVSSSFNLSQTIFAYAGSYDWSKGAKYYNQQQPNPIWLHGVSANEITPKQKTGGYRR